MHVIHRERTAAPPARRYRRSLAYAGVVAFTLHAAAAFAGVERSAAVGALGARTPAVPLAPDSRLAAAPSDDQTIPVYRTRLPPAATLRYGMKRGVLSGTGDLTWRPQGDRYVLKLEAKVAGLDVLTQTSSGTFDAAGVAPLRFDDQRLRRDPKVANFRRAGGTISFSGRPDALPLHPGEQDRLSWMVQLAAIVEADPKWLVPGAWIAMHVVGAQANAGAWVFRCIGAEVVQTGAGPIDTIKFVREPRDDRDTSVQVWLDPKQHHLPVRALQQSGSGEEPFDLKLRAR